MNGLKLFFHNAKYTMLSMFRLKVTLFWTLAFPLLLATFMYMAFGNLFEKDEMFKTINVAVVESENDDTLMSVLESLDINHTDSVSKSDKNDDNANCRKNDRLFRRKPARYPSFSRGLGICKADCRAGENRRRGKEAHGDRRADARHRLPALPQKIRKHRRTSSGDRGRAVGSGVFMRHGTFRKGDRPRRLFGRTSSQLRKGRRDRLSDPFGGGLYRQRKRKRICKAKHRKIYGKSHEDRKRDPPFARGFCTQKINRHKKREGIRPRDLLFCFISSRSSKYWYCPTRRWSCRR